MILTSAGVLRLPQHLERLLLELITEHLQIHDPIQATHHVVSQRLKFGPAEQVIAHDLTLLHGVRAHDRCSALIRSLDWLTLHSFHGDVLRDEALASGLLQK